MAKPAWEIIGYDGLRRIWSCSVPLGLSESEVMTILQRLASHDLTRDEIVSASLRKRMKGRSGLLDVRKDGPHPEFLVGENPHYAARVVRNA
jgi:hypothetical protein